MEDYNYNIDQLKQSVVKILSDDGKTIAGSGFIIRSDGYLITCHHVIYLSDSLKVEYQGRIYEAQWQEELSNPEVDIAILRIDVEDVEAVPIINPQDLSTSVTVYGFPKSKEINFPEGFDVSAQSIRRSAPINTISTYPAREPSSTNPWNKFPEAKSTFFSHRIDAKVDPGTSGGPVFANELGGVVGVIQCSKSDESYVIRWDNITKTLDKLGLEPRKNAVCRFLEEIEEEFKYMKLFHSPQEIVLEDQYIPIDVTLERKYRHEVETSWGYAESEEELKRAYALKGVDVESQPSQVPWEEAKKEHQKIMVLADPGMGKSTLLKMEALSIAKDERQKLLENEKNVDDLIFPIVLTLSKLDQEEKPVSNAILDLISQKYPETSEGIVHLLKQKLNDGKCRLLLDALDEVPKERRNDLSEKLNIFARHYSCPIICTSRIVGYAGVFVADAKEVEIVPFSQKQVEQYVETWFTNAAGSINNDSVSADGLLRELRNKPQIRGLTQNPLLLSLLCSLYQEKELMLPARRCQIYEKAVDYMLSKWSQNRRPQSQGKIIAKIRLLKELAYHFTCKGVEIFSSDELFDGIEEYLQSERATTVFKNSDTDELMAELSEEDGILLQLEKNGERYLFLHRTFQEYLTASYLNRAIQRNQSDGIDLAREHFWEYDWHETLSLLAGLMKDPVPLLQAITDEKDDIFSSLLLLAGRCIAECEENSHPLIAEVIERIYGLWRYHPSLGFIKLTVVALGQANSQMLERLETAVHDENREVRLWTVMAFGKIGDEQAVDVLIQELNHEDYEVRYYAAEALGEIGSKQTVDALIQMLKDEDRNVGRVAAEALGKIGGEQVVDALIQMLKDKYSCSVRWPAAEALGEIGGEQVVDVLIQTLKDEDSFVRRSAAGALGKIGSEQVVDVLIQMLKDEDRFVRWRAAEASGKIGSEQAVDVLIQTFKDEDRIVRWQAALALGEIGSEQAIDVLIRTLRDENNSIRYYAAESLGRIGNEQAIDVLIQALKDEDRKIRSLAAEVLGKIDSQQSVGILIKALRDEDSFVRYYAAMSLGRIGSEQATDALIEALNREYSFVRISATEALEKVGTLETLEKLIQSPEIDIYAPHTFSLARTLAVRFSKEETPFIPVYPELIRGKSEGRGA